MRTNIKFAVLAAAVSALAGQPENAGRTGDELRKAALAQAIDYELKLPGWALEIAGQGAWKHCGGARFVHGTERSTLKAPSIEHIKSFLALKYATSSSNPVLNDVSNEFEQYFHNNMPEMDIGWTALFDLVDLRNSSHDHFDILTTSAGVSFDSIGQGGEVKVRREIAESKATCSMVTYGAGLGILDEWINDQKFWSIDEAVAEFRAAYWDKLAAIHFGLLTALSAGIDVAFSTDDTTTFNLAAATIIRGVAASGYATGSNPGLYIVCSPEKVGRILRMLDATQGSFMVAMQANKEPVAYSVKGVIATRYVAAADTGYYLVLPNRKLKRGVKQDLALESNRDIYKAAVDWVGRMRFNAIVADSTQVRRVKYA